MSEGGRLVLYVINSAPFFMSHRLPVAMEARRRGFKVAVAGGDAEAFTDEFDKLGIQVIQLPANARGIAPWSDIRDGLRLASEIRRLKPTVVQAVGMKGMLLTAIAGWVGPLPRTVGLATGLGFVFESASAKATMVRTLLKPVLRGLFRRRQNPVIFQNPDDRALWISQGLVRPYQAHLIRSSGVDPDEFYEVPEPDGLPPVVVFPARLLIPKGVREFVQAADILKARGIEARCALVGGLDPGNPESLSEGDVADLERRGRVEVWGQRRDMHRVFASCNIVCLPSYREGVPKALIEAASVGRAIVATDVPGCREVVQHDVNGLLAPARDAEALADALQLLLADRGRRLRFAAAGRARVLDLFTAERVARETVDLYGPCSPR